jgi:SAM-dependent methyltransferase
MEREVFERLETIEKEHWWFVARRRILASILTRLVKPLAKPRILEAGCGTGGNLRMLSAFGDVDAFEPDEKARLHARRTSGLEVCAGDLPAGIPYPKGTFDLIVALDVLEHVERDEESLAELRDRLRPGGAMVVTVPAFPFLWSHHDDVHHHFRRYRGRELRDKLQRAGFEIVRMTYFNTFLFPLISAVRLAKRITGRTQSDDDRMPGRVTNTLLRAMFSSERWLVNAISLPFGVSLLAIARRPS